eukprot:776381-Amphidinium_carterae.2
MIKKRMSGTNKQSNTIIIMSTIKPALAPEVPPPSGGATTFMVVVVVTVSPSTTISPMLSTADSDRLVENPASIRPASTALSKSVVDKPNRDCTTSSTIVVEPSGIVVTNSISMLELDAVKRRISVASSPNRRLLMTVAVQTT